MYEFIEERIIHGAVLVHCQAGMSRSAAILASYLKKKKKIGSADAVSFIKSKRPLISPNSGFLSQLKVYENEIL